MVHVEQKGHFIVLLHKLCCPLFVACVVMCVPLFWTALNLFQVLWQIFVALATPVYPEPKTAKLNYTTVIPA